MHSLGGKTWSPIIRNQVRRILHAKLVIGIMQPDYEDSTPTPKGSNS
jgi:hypothetical protein